MFLRTETFPAKTLVGLHLNMSIAHNKTFELWNSFMPRRAEINNIIGSEMYSMQVYKPHHNMANLQATFEKWAAVEVGDTIKVPEGMEMITIPTGKYAVFLHKGPASEGYKTFQYIFGSWLPNSGYQLDDRPHFEILGEKYRNNDPNSEEEIFIPIR
ncbi:MAG: GyrI-like domain-containing protein [Pedobacter sp.]|nr:GyrI-like domain-containing protein [Pedobacter sp.]